MQISQSERDADYKTIFARRDVRGEFLPDPIPDEVLQRILTAAHHAPSVGFMHEALGIPARIVPIAYLCLGYVSAFHDRPELESAGWLPRLDLQTLIHQDVWGSGV